MWNKRIAAFKTGSPLALVEFLMTRDKGKSSLNNNNINNNNNNNIKTSNNNNGEHREKGKSSNNGFLKLSLPGNIPGAQITDSPKQIVVGLMKIVQFQTNLTNSNHHRDHNVVLRHNSDWVASTGG